MASKIACPIPVPAKRRRRFWLSVEALFLRVGEAQKDDFLPQKDVQQRLRDVSLPLPDVSKSLPDVRQ